MSWRERETQRPERADAWEAKLPALEAWIDTTIAQYASQARPVSELNLPRLSKLYPPEILSRMKYVVVDKVPTLPFSELGISGFEKIEKQKTLGFVYKNTIFAKPSVVKNESFWAHELIHTLQWEQLGGQTFLHAYMASLVEKGEPNYKAYRTNPLEIMAYNLQDYFDLEVGTEGNPNNLGINIEALVREQLRPIRAKFTKGRDAHSI